MSIKNVTRPKRAYSVVAGAVVCIVAVAALPRSAVAQGSVSAVATDQSAPSGQIGTIPGCGVAASFSSVTSYNCGPVPLGGFASGGSGVYVGSGYASALAGQLRASTNGTVVIGGYAGAFSYATSFWTDQALVTPVGAAAPMATQLQIALHVTGTLSAVTGSGGPGAGAVATLRLPVDVPIGRSFEQYQWVSGPGAPNPTSSVDGVFLMTLALSNGSTGDFQYGIGLNTTLSSSGSDPADPALTGSAAADFSHTINPVWFHVLDASGADVTAAYDVTFQQGMAFGPDAITTTPESSSLALLATGLIPLVPVLRRRRTPGRFAPQR